jgi:hypothetical protein
MFTQELKTTSAAALREVGAGDGHASDDAIAAAVADAGYKAVSR